MSPTHLGAIQGWFKHSATDPLFLYRINNLSNKKLHEILTNKHLYIIIDSKLRLTIQIDKVNIQNFQQLI